MIDHDLQGEIDGHTWTVDLPVYIDCTYQQGKYDEEDVACHGYAVDAPLIAIPRQTWKYYSRRFGIELTYRLSGTKYCDDDDTESGDAVSVRADQLPLPEYGKFHGNAGEDG